MACEALLQHLGDLALPIHPDVVVEQVEIWRICRESWREPACIHDCGKGKAPLMMDRLALQRRATLAGVEAFRQQLASNCIAWALVHDGQIWPGLTWVCLDVFLHPVLTRKELFRMEQGSSCDFQQHQEMFTLLKNSNAELETFTMLCSNPQLDWQTPLWIYGQVNWTMSRIWRYEHENRESSRQWSSRCNQGIQRTNHMLADRRHVVKKETLKDNCCNNNGATMCSRLWFEIAESLAMWTCQPRSWSHSWWETNDTRELYERSRASLLAPLYWRKPNIVSANLRTTTGLTATLQRQVVFAKQKSSKVQAHHSEIHRTTSETDHSQHELQMLIQKFSDEQPMERGCRKIWKRCGGVPNNSPNLFDRNARARLAGTKILSGCIFPLGMPVTWWHVRAFQLKNIRGSRSFSDSGRDKQWWWRQAEACPDCFSRERDTGT